MIKTIRIQNFRSLTDVTVELDPLTVLIGRSGTGKSNFVRAIRFLRDCLANRGAYLSGEKGVSSILPVGRLNSELSYDVSFGVAALDNDLSYTVANRQQRCRT